MRVQNQLCSSYDQGKYGCDGYTIDGKNLLYSSKCLLAYGDLDQSSWMNQTFPLQMFHVRGFIQRFHVATPITRIRTSALKL